MTQRKCLTMIEELQTLTNDLRQRGRRIVFTNGCYDVLHVGHVRCLEAARREGDVLVVGINSDASVAALKGAGRPVLPVHERAEILLALRAVDYVYVFDAPTVAGILSVVKPDVYAKGTEYSLETIPADERASLAAYGGVFRAVGDAKTHSTSALIARIAAPKKRVT